MIMLCSSQRTLQQQVQIILHLNKVTTSAKPGQSGQSLNLPSTSFTAKTCELNLTSKPCNFRDFMQFHALPPMDCKCCLLHKAWTGLNHALYVLSLTLECCSSRICITTTTASHANKPCFLAVFRHQLTVGRGASCTRSGIADM